MSPDSHLPGPPMRNLTDMEFYTASGSPSPWTAFGQAPHIQHEVYSDGSVGRLKEWLDSCEQDHELCRFSGHEYQPKRLLAIRLCTHQPTVCGHLTTLLTCGWGRRPDTEATDPDGVFQVQLVETVPGRRYHYAALSHIWAETNPLRTTASTMHRHQQPMSVHELPDAFRDAAILTLLLGLDYIWIDSLCIVQDDASDWNEHAPQMYSIYSGAEFVIAAHGPDLGMVKPPPEPIHDKQRPGDPPIFYRESTSDLHASFFSNPKDTSSWFGRAWCMQERIFARRVVHFGGGVSEEIVLECNTTITCECGGLPNQDKGAGSGGSQTLKAEMVADLMPFTLTLSAVSESSLDELWKFYVKACENYTARGLTYGTDTLPAVSSLMGKLRPYLGDYYAGLWQYNLLLGLQWEALDTRKSSRHAKYVAPTFSWTSRSGAVIWYADPGIKPSESIHDFARVISVRCLTSTEDPCGSVIAGSITLRGHVTTTMTIADTQMHAPDGRVRLVKDGTPPCFVIFDSREDYEGLEAGAAVVCLDVMRDKSDKENDSNYVSGLVLVPLELPDSGEVYKRVGFSTMRVKHFSDAVVEEVTIV
ncbi:heterokaryon incompatibility protein-domain-containing protein [Xylariaceae sp. FL0594]|nr:heterokaryon incompatibility protein-domain-containing protein [Xylariaceae sp. FL0594]